LFGNGLGASAALGSKTSNDKETYVYLPKAGENKCSAYVPAAGRELKSGTDTIKYTVGSQDDQYDKSGKVEYTRERKQCIDYEAYKRDDKLNVSILWNITDAKKHWSGVVKLISAESKRVQDNNNTYTVTNAKHSWEETEIPKNSSTRSSTDSYSAKGLREGHKFEKYGIVVTNEVSSKYNADRESFVLASVSGTLRGSYNYEKYKGWFMVETNQKFIVENPHENPACAQGKATIKGKDTTIVVECKEKKVEVTYNGKKVEMK
jgi:hypothetical protein